MNNQRDRIKSLDSLRGVAAIAIVLFHYFYIYPTKYGIDSEVVHAFYLFQVGVHLFFIISGFVIFMTISRSLNIFQFVWGRFSRLYPVYWCCVLITFLVVSIFGPENRVVSVNVAIINLSMFQEYFSISHVDGVYWTLSIELAFYILVGFAFVAGLIKHTEYVCIAWLSFAICVNYLNINVGILEQALLLDWCQFFCAGIGYYYLWKTNRKSPLSLIILFLSIFYSFLVLEDRLIYSVILMYFIFAIAVFLFPGFQKIKIIQWIGSISYPLYLIHQNIGYSLISNMISFGFQYKVAVAAAIILSVSIAYILHRYVEYPLLIKSKNVIFFKERVRYESP